MKLTTFLFAAIAAYSLLQFIVIPETDQKWAANRTIAKASKIGLLAALRSLRTVLQIAIITYSVLYVLLGLLTIVGTGEFRQNATSRSLNGAKSGRTLSPVGAIIGV